MGETTAGCAAATQAGDGPVAAGREHGLRAALSIAFLALRNSRTLLEQPGVSRALQAAPHADQLALRLVRAEADVALELVAPVLLATRPRVAGVVELAAAGLDHQARALLMAARAPYSAESPRRPRSSPGCAAGVARLREAGTHS